MDNKGSNFRTDADGLYPTPGVGNISPNDNPDLAGSINSQTIPTSTGDQYNHDLGNRVNELFSNPENPFAQDGKTQNREEPEIGKEEIFFAIPFSLSLQRPLKNIIFAHFLPFISSTRCTSSFTPSLCKSITTSMEGFSCKIFVIDGSILSYAPRMFVLPSTIS